MLAAAGTDIIAETSVGNYVSCMKMRVTSSEHFSFEVSLKSVEHVVISVCGTENDGLKDVYCTTQVEKPDPSSASCENFYADSEDGVCYQVTSYHILDSIVHVSLFPCSVFDG